jgi:hypothetical protein
MVNAYVYKGCMEATSNCKKLVFGGFRAKVYPTVQFLIKQDISLRFSVDRFNFEGRMHPSFQSGNSSAGRARPCQGRGREFESRFPLQFFSC